MELRSAVGRSRAATNGRARNHRQCGNTWLAADPSAAIASRSACAGFDRTRRVCGNFWRRGRRILVTRMRLRCRPRSVLQEANLQWFVVDAHGLLFGTPRPCRATYAPCYTPAGPAAFARDPSASRQVWSAHEGYAGDSAYRDFYRDIGFDLPLQHLGPIARGTRKFSGVKYHRITGRGDEKQLYDRTAAENAAARHAIHFLEQCHQQIRDIGEVGFEPIVVAPFDAELFGHWWFEGPIFLEQFIRHAT